MLPSGHDTAITFGTHSKLQLSEQGLQQKWPHQWSILDGEWLMRPHPPEELQKPVVAGGANT